MLVQLQNSRVFMRNRSRVDEVRKGLYLGRGAQVTHHLSDVLDDGHSVFPAVVPELRCRKLPLQNDGGA